MKNVKIVLKPKQGPILGPPKTNKRLGDISSRYGILFFGGPKIGPYMGFETIFTFFIQLQ